MFREFHSEHHPIRNSPVEENTVLNGILYANLEAAAIAT